MHVVLDAFFQLNSPTLISTACVIIVDLKVSPNVASLSLMEVITYYRYACLFNNKPVNFVPVYWQDFGLKGQRSRLITIGRNTI